MRLSNKLIGLLILMGVFLFVGEGNLLSQQLITVPRVSQKAVTAQRIGLTDITIEYHRPLVKGRQIWGKLVPFNQVWRAGANENTTIDLTDEVEIEGKKLPAGKYGLHMIPTKSDWTIIFSKINTAWGSFSYDEQDDALRVQVKPETAPFEEALNYRFDNPTENSVAAALYWEKIRVPFSIKVDVQEVVLSNIRKELYGIAQFGWRGWMQAANYCRQNNINHDEALRWIDRSITAQENFANLEVKAALLKQAGREQESRELMDHAMEIASEGEINLYGYQLMNAGKMERAIEIFKKNVKDHPDSWNVYDSLGEAYAKSGKTKEAVKFYKKAYEMTQDSRQKERIAGILENLRSN